MWARLQLGPNWQAANTIEVRDQIKNWPLLMIDVGVGVDARVRTCVANEGFPLRKLLVDLMFSDHLMRPTLSLLFSNGNFSLLVVYSSCSREAMAANRFVSLVAHFHAVFVLGKHDCVWGGVLPFRLSPQHGSRVGEAAHPGPCQFKDFRLCILNPTAVFRKAPAFNKLNVQVLFLAETSQQPHKSWKRVNCVRLLLKSNGGILCSHVRATTHCLTQLSEARQRVSPLHLSCRSGGCSPRCRWSGIRLAVLLSPGFGWDRCKCSRLLFMLSWMGRTLSLRMRCCLHLRVIERRFAGQV